MAGWSSYNKYSLLGGLRAAAQVISYNTPLTLSVVGLIILAGTMSLHPAIDEMTLRGRIEQGRQGREPGRGVVNGVHGRTLQATPFMREVQCSHYLLSRG